MKLLNLAGFAAFLYVIAQSVYAHPLTEWECRAYANDAYNVAKVRDMGVDRGTVLQALQLYLNNKPANSYIKDVHDLNMVVKMVNKAFDSDEEPPLAFSERNYNACVSESRDKEV